MVNFRISRAFRQFADLLLLALAKFVYQCMSSNTSLFPEPTPTMLNFKACIDEFEAALLAAEERARTAIRTKKAQRLALISMMNKLANYVEFIAEENADTAASSGFPLIKPRESRTLTVPEGLKVQHGLQTGEVISSVQRQAAAASYLHEYTSDPELKADSWKNVSCISHKCTIKGLTPGVTYYFRVGVVGYKEQVLYGSVASLMAV